MDNALNAYLIDFNCWIHLVCLMLLGLRAKSYWWNFWFSIWLDGSVFGFSHSDIDRPFQNHQIKIVTFVVNVFSFKIDRYAVSTNIWLVVRTQKLNKILVLEKNTQTHRLNKLTFLKCLNGIFCFCWDWDNNKNNINTRKIVDIWHSCEKKDMHGYRTNIHHNVLCIDTFKQNRCDSILIGYDLYNEQKSIGKWWVFQWYVRASHYNFWRGRRQIVEENSFFKICTLP